MTARARTIRSTSRPMRTRSGHLVGVAHADHVLIDDRAGVELGGHVVGGRADQFDAALVGAGVGIGADEGWKEAVVDVDRRRAYRGEEPGGEDLHVAGEDQQVDFADQLQRLGAPPPPASRVSIGTWWKGSPTASTSARRSSWLEMTT